LSKKLGRNGSSKIDNKVGNIIKYNCLDILWNNKRHDVVSWNSMWHQEWSSLREKVSGDNCDKSNRNLKKGERDGCDLRLGKQSIRRQSSDHN